MDINTDNTPTLDTDVDPNGLHIVVPSVPKVEPTPDVVATPATIPDVNTPLATPDTTNDNAVLIDNVQYILDDQGNALNEDKSVKFTAAQLEAFENTSTDSPIDMSVIAAHVNFTPLDEQGTPINYDSTPEGVATYLNDTIQQRVPELVQEYLAQTFASNPELARAADYIERYGSLAGIESNVDYSGVDITSADEQTLYNMVVAREMANGETLTDAKTTADLYKDAKKLTERATKSKEYFVAKSANEKATATEQARVQQLEVQKYWNDIKNTVTSRKLMIGNEQITIPPVIKVKTGDGKTENRTPEDFFAYISVPKVFDVDGVKQNLTQSQYDELMEVKSRTAHNDIFEALKRFTKYDTEQFVKDVRKAKDTKAIRTISTTSTKGNANQPKVARLQ